MCENEIFELALERVQARYGSPSQLEEFFERANAKPAAVPA